MGREAHQVVQWTLPEVRDTLPEVSEGSGHPPGGPGGVMRHTQRSGRPCRRSRTPSRRSGRGQDTLPEVREGSESTPGGSVDPPGGLGGVGTPSRKSGGVRTPYQRSGTPSWRPEIPSCRSWKVRDTLPKVREGSGGTPRGSSYPPGGPGNPLGVP